MHKTSKVIGTSSIKWEVCFALVTDSTLISARGGIKIKPKKLESGD
jgi:hypothetical protein